MWEQGRADWGGTGWGRAAQCRVGQVHGRAGQGRVELDMAGQHRQGRVGLDRATYGRAVQNRAGQDTNSVKIHVKV